MSCIPESCEYVKELEQKLEQKLIIKEGIEKILKSRIDELEQKLATIEKLHNSTVDTFLKLAEEQKQKLADTQKLLDEAVETITDISNVAFISLGEESYYVQKAEIFLEKIKELK